MLPTISIKGGITTADGYSCVTAGATSNVFAMASSDIDTLSNKTTVDTGYEQSFRSALLIQIVRR